MIVKDYECKKCNATKNPKTYMPMQSSVPKCPRCKEYMTEYEDG